MEIIKEGLELLGKIVAFYGGGVTIFGFFAVMEAYKEQNPSAQANAFKNIMSGIGIVLIGMYLLPKLISLIPA